MVSIERYKDYAPVIVRLSVAFLFLWFGLTQIFDPDYLLGYLPQWAYDMPIEPKQIVFINGVSETILGVVLGLGLFTRIVSLILGLHLFSIAFAVGYNDVGVRDLALGFATLSIFIHGNDKLCLGKRLFHSSK